ncbi:MAG: hypothetical protein NZ742_06760 [Acidobacteria bacterium]|nr:hypothetical protein [Acidobacteriota bacterium]MDW7984579.1 hypothetical protein [Acidobacteriota bacterium]
MWELGALVTLHVRQAYHRWRTWPHRWAWTLFGIAVAFVFGVLLLTFFARTFHYLNQLPEFTRPFVMGFLQRLMAALLLALTTMVFLSSVLNALSLLYLRDDLEFLLALPVRRSVVLGWRTLGVVFQSTYMVYLVMIPVWLAMVWKLDLPVRFVGWAFLTMSLYVVPVVLLGVAATSVLVRVFPVRRLHQFVTVLLGVVVAGLLFYIRMMRPEQWVRPLEPGELWGLLRQLETPGSAWLPYGWASVAMLAPFVQPAWMTQVSHAGPALIAWGVAVPALAWAVARRTFYGSWLKAREALSRIGRRSRRAHRGLRSSSVNLWLLAKEWWFFSRDPAQWGHFLLVGAVLAVYFFNVRLIPIPHPAMAYFVWTLNVAMTGFILSALAARFVLPAFSNDGPAYWLLYVLPLDPGRVYWIRWGFYTVSLTVVSEVLLLGSLRLQRLSHPAFVALNAYMALALAVVLGTMALTAGVRFRRHEDAHASVRLAVGAGGLLYMLVGFLWVVWTLAAALPWVWFHVRAEWWGGRAPLWVYGLLGLHGLSTIISTIGLMRRGLAESRTPPMYA